MRVAVYGGSFNPPHVGHAMVAAWIGWTGRADQVWFLPAYRHAFDKPLAPWDLRLRMTEALADAVGPHARVEPIESTLPVPSYTIHTMEALVARHPEHQFRLVVGADVLPQLPLWKESERLTASFPFLVVGREGYGPVADAPSFPDISSTDVRARVSAGLPVDHLLPRGVLAVVEAHGLYRA